MRNQLLILSRFLSCKPSVWFQNSLCLLVVSYGVSRSESLWIYPPCVCFSSTFTKTGMKLSSLEFAEFPGCVGYCFPSNFENFWPLLFQIFFLPLSLLFWDSHYADGVSQISKVLFIFLHFFLFLFLRWIISIVLC